jgi:hypothetical protein
MDSLKTERVVCFQMRERGATLLLLIYLSLYRGKYNTNTSLAATMVRWFEGGVNQGLLPMTSEEESN